MNDMKETDIWDESRPGKKNGKRYSKKKKKGSNGVW